jgi:uncharacterized membrane protein YcaP (DUF421 family)
MDVVLHYLIIAGKSIAIYLFIIIAIRLFGKKELAQLSVIDLVFILLISNSVQNAMVGNDTSLPGGICAALGLFICNYIFKYLLRVFPGLSALVQGEKIILIHEGQILSTGLKEAQMSADELERAIREHGVEEVNKVDLCVLEVDGNISVLTHDYTQKTVKFRKKKPQLGNRS